jgi:two-component system chemotaxis response regulator CheB
MQQGIGNKAIAIGGSAGSLTVLIDIVKLLPPAFVIPIIIVIHRQRTGASELPRILYNLTGHSNIIEPEDKEQIKEGYVYIAPQNYHLLVESNFSFGLDYSEAVNYSRPSIDVTFESAARVYRENLTAIILSGANSDGTAGLTKVVAYGGKAVAQMPATAQYPAMPCSAIKTISKIEILNPEQISQYINGLVAHGK